MASLARIIVSVSSLDQSLQFYVGALELTSRWRTTEVAILDGQGFALMLLQRAPTPSPAGVAVALRVRDVDAATTSALAAGGTLVSGPRREAWGERQAVVQDPDGNVVHLVAPAGPPGP